MNEWVNNERMLQTERSLNSRLEDCKSRLEASESSNRTMKNYVHFLKKAYTNAFNDSTLAMNVSPPRTSLFWPHHHHHHHNRFTTLFRDHTGEPVPEENFWSLWCKGRLTEADTPTIRLGATPSGLTSANLHHPPIFYRPDALPVAQPTASKHWRTSTFGLGRRR